MCVALIGGMDRLEQHYRCEAKKFGIELKVFNTSSIGMSSKLRNVDAMVIFTNKVSHRARKEALNIARSGNIPVFQYHSCGLCTLRECFNHMSQQKKRGEETNG